MIRNALLLAAALVLPSPSFAAVADRVFSDGFDRLAPVVLYTDIVSGPTSGGENGKGCYLSVFGRNFGSGVPGTNVRVFVGTGEVADYRTFGPSRGRADIQQITVQLGALGSDAVTGAQLPVRVVVDGAPSNTDHVFTINPGRMIFVDAANGVDATAQVGNIAKPYRSVQTGGDFSGGAWGQVRAGDFLVLRGGTYTGVGFENYFMRFMIRANGVPDRSSGTPPTGAGTGPITLMAYPGETAFIDADAATHAGGALSGLNGENYPLAGKWIVIAGLKVEGGGYDGPVSQQIHGDHWRIVNNELTAFTGVTGGASPSRMGGITGNGDGSVWLGNHIHDIQGSENEAHGIYIDGDGSYDIGYNDIHDIHSGKGIQLFANGGNGSDSINHVRIHHNRIQRVTQFGINIADGSQDDIAIFDNLVTDAKVAGLRFNTNTLHGCRVYNNTFYNNNTLDSEIYGVLMNDWGFPADALDVRNNIFWARTGTAYAGGSVGFDDPIGVIRRNLWFGAGNTGFGFDTNPLNADPQLVAPGTDFHIATATSPAVDAGDATAASLVTNDFDANRPRPHGAGIDVGAYEF